MSLKMPTRFPESPLLYWLLLFGEGEGPCDGGSGVGGGSGKEVAVCHVDLKVGVWGGEAPEEPSGSGMCPGSQ